MSFDDDDFWKDLNDEDSSDPLLDTPISKGSREVPQQQNEQAKKSSRGRKKNSVPEGQLDLLSNFWDEDLEEEKELALQDRFFIRKDEEPKNRKSDEGVSRKVNVGLYPSDAELLEDIFKQSKKAGLKNVSRARILRVALRHFHTCWLNRKDD